MSRHWPGLCVLLAVAATPAPVLADTPADGRFAGPTSQDTKPATTAFDISNEGRLIGAIRFPSVARCGPKTKFRLTTLVRRPARLATGPRIKLRGTLKGSLARGSTYRAVFRMDGRFPSKRSARGTWGLRAVVRNRRGRITARCRTGTVGWRAARL